MGNDVDAVVTTETVGAGKSHEPRPSLLYHPPCDLIELLLVTLFAHKLNSGFGWFDRIRRSAV